MEFQLRSTKQYVGYEGDFKARIVELPNRPSNRNDCEWELQYKDKQLTTDTNTSVPIAISEINRQIRIIKEALEQETKEV